MEPVQVYDGSGEDADLILTPPSGLMWQHSPKVFNQSWYGRYVNDLTGVNTAVSLILDGELWGCFCGDEDIGMDFTTRHGALQALIAWLTGAP